MSYRFLCKYNKQKSAPTEAPLSHRKHHSLNASSVVPPLIPWLCDITLQQHVAQLSNLCRAASSAHVVIGSDAGSGVWELTNQSRPVIQEGSLFLKETGANDE